MRRRPAAFVWLVVLAAGASAISIQAPWLTDVVRVHSLAVATAPDRLSDTTVVIAVGGGQNPDIDLEDVGRMSSSFADVPPMRLTSTVVISSSPVEWTAGDAPAVHAGIAVAAPSGCPPTIVRGRCPDSENEVVVPSTYSASTITLPEAGVTFDVVGAYDPVSRGGSLGSIAGDALGTRAGSTADDLVLTKDGFVRTEATVNAFGIVQPSRSIRPEEVSPILTAVARARATATQSFGSMSVITRLSALLIRVGHQQAAAGTLLVFTGIQGLSVAWYSVGMFVGRLSRARAREWGTTRLRGSTLGRRLAVILAEPAIAIGAGSIIGAALGAGLAIVLARTVVGTGALPSMADSLIWIAAGLALVGSSIALLVVASRASRVPLDDLMRASVEPRRISRAGLVVQSITVVTAVVVVAAVLTQGRISGLQLPVLAPILVAASVGILALRLAVVVVRHASRRPPSSLAGVVVARRLSRTPSAFIAATAVVLALTLLAFTADMTVVAARLQRDRAEASVAAADVVRVSVPSGVSLRDAVRRADPSGTRAMAVRQVTDALGTRRIVAVDTSRLAAVTAWRSSWAGRSFARLRQELAPSVGPTLTVRGSQLRMRVAGVATDPVRLIAVVATASTWRRVSLGTLRDGELSSQPGALPCRDGCRIVRFGVESTSLSSQTYTTRFTVTGISTDVQDETSLRSWLDAGRWRLRLGGETNPGALPTGRVRSDGGLTVSGTEPDGTEVLTFAPRDVPEPLPALVGPDTGPDLFAPVRGAARGAGLDGDPLLIRVIGRASILPRSLGDGVLVDLRLIERVSNPRDESTRDEVWFSPGPRGAILDRLRDRGIRILSTEDLAATSTMYGTEAQATAAALALPVGVVQALLVLAALLATRVVDSGFRRRDAQALSEAGVTRSRLRRLVSGELVVVNGIAVLLGTAAGIAIFAPVSPGLPLLVGDGVSPPPDFSSAWPTVAVILGAAYLIVVALALVVPPIELRGIGLPGRARREEP